MLQLLVYVREKYKNYSSLFGAFYYYNPGQKVRDTSPFSLGFCMELAANLQYHS